VAIHQRRRRQPALGVDHLRRVGIQFRPDPEEATALDAQVDDPLADTYVANEEVHRVTVNR
jgi:hypothetical protein